VNKDVYSSFITCKTQVAAGHLSAAFRGPVILYPR